MMTLGARDLRWVPLEGSKVSREEQATWEVPLVVHGLLGRAGGVRSGSPGRGLCCRRGNTGKQAADSGDGTVLKTKAPIWKSRPEVSRAGTDWSPFLQEDTASWVTRTQGSLSCLPGSLTCFGVFRMLAWKPWKM